MSCLQYENIFLDNMLIVIYFLRMKELYMERKINYKKKENEQRRENK